MSRPKIKVETGVNPYANGSGFEVDIAVEWDSDTGTKIIIDRQAIIAPENWDALKAEVDRALEYVRNRP